MKEAGKGGVIVIINTSDHATDCTLLLNATKTNQTTSSVIIVNHAREAKNLQKIPIDSNRQIIVDQSPDQQRAVIFFTVDLNYTNLYN